MIRVQHGTCPPVDLRPSGVQVSLAVDPEIDSDAYEWFCTVCYAHVYTRAPYDVIEALLDQGVPLVLIEPPITEEDIDRWVRTASFYPETTEPSR